MIINMVMIDFQSMDEYTSFSREVGYDGYIKEIEDDLIQVVFDYPPRELLQKLSEA